jgi:hypothetical protein
LLAPGNIEMRRMDAMQIFWPVLAQVALTIAMYFVLGARKARAIKAGRVDRRQAALNNRLWPDDVIKVSNNIANQFETPVLFYVLCLLLYVIGGAGIAAVTLAWVFVISRCAHAYVHIGSNYVPMRTRLFLIACLALLAMALLAAIELAG